MLLTRECDYAVRVVRYLANLEVNTVGAICERENIPAPFAYKILKKLEHAGIVKSRRGADGGYQLVKDPDNITLLDIVAAVDKRLFVNECMRQDYICPRNINGNCCGVHDELCRIQDIVINALKEKSMHDLV